MSDDPAAVAADDAGWDSSDGNWWAIANIGFDLGIDRLSSDVPPRPGDIPPNDVEGPPADRMVDVGPPEPDPSLDRPSLDFANPPLGDSDTPPTSNGDPPPDRIGDVPRPEPADFTDRPVPGFPADPNYRPIPDAGQMADSAHAPPRETVPLPSPAALSHNTIYFRPDTPPLDSDNSPPSGGADPRVDPACLSDQGNADPDPRDVSTPPAATSDDPSLQVMLAGAWHL